jgi:nitrite reductase (NO-forming)
MKFGIFLSTASTLLLAFAGTAHAADGKAVYDQSCGACHNSMSPKVGDKAAWAKLIQKGVPALVDSTIKGEGVMPPRGGHPTLSDADITAAVEYLVSKSR